MDKLLLAVSRRDHPLKFSGNELEVLLGNDAANDLRKTGFLVQAKELEEILCAECGEHSTAVKKKSEGFYGVCEIEGYFSIPIGDVEMWRFDVSKLIGLLVSELGGVSVSADSVTDVQLIARKEINGAPVGFYFGRNEEEASLYLRSQGVIDNSVVLLPAGVSHKELNGLVATLFVPISDFLSVVRDGLSFRSDELVKLVLREIQDVVFEENGDLYYKGEKMGTLPPASDDHSFVKILYENYGQAVSHEAIVEACKKGKMERTPQEFCNNLRTNANKLLGGRLGEFIKSQKTSDGKNGYRMG